MSFPDDDNDSSTARGSTASGVLDAQSEDAASDRTTKAGQAPPAPEARESVEDAPTPASDVTSNARAEASWRLYEGQLGRRLPDL